MEKAIAGLHAPPVRLLFLRRSRRGCCETSGGGCGCCRQRDPHPQPRFLLRGGEKVKQSLTQRFSIPVISSMSSSVWKLLHTLKKKKKDESVRKTIFKSSVFQLFCLWNEL